MSGANFFYTDKKTDKKYKQKQVQKHRLCYACGVLLNSARIAAKTSWPACYYVEQL